MVLRSIEKIAALWLLRRRHKPTWFLFKRLLYLAAKNNWFNIVDLLITEFSVDVNSVAEQKTALIGAAEGGNFEMVKKLSSSGAALEPLRRTCRRESRAKGGAQIVTYEKLNKTALHVACVNENYDIVEFLADKGGASYVDVVDSFGRTALFYAALAEKPDIMRLLVHHGASVNVLDDEGMNPLLFVCSQYANKIHHYDVVRYLLHCGSKTRCGSLNAPVIATNRGHFTIVELLMEYVSDLDEVEKHLILAEACRKGQEKLVAVLLSRLSNENGSRDRHLSLLCVAVINGHTSIATMLLDKGVDVNALDSNNMTPLMCAIEYFFSVLNFSETGDEIAAKLDGRLSLVKLMLQYGADVNVVSRFHVHWSGIPLRVVYPFMISNVHSRVHNILEVPLLAVFHKLLNNCADMLYSCSKQTIGKIMDFRFELIQLLIDSGTILDCVRRSHETNHPRRTHFSRLSNYEAQQALIYLFKAGASLNMLHWASNVIVDVDFRLDIEQERDYRTNYARALELTGFTFDEDAPPAIRRFMHYCESLFKKKKTGTLLSLSQQCRVALRKHIFIVADRRSILPLIDQLPLPTQLKFYLRFEGDHAEVDLGPPSGPGRHSIK